MGLTDKALRAQSAADSDQDDGLSWDISPDQRIGRLPNRRRRKWMRRAVVLVISSVGGYAIYDDPARLTDAWTAATTRLSPVVEQLLHRDMAATNPPASPPFPATPASTAPAPASAPLSRPAIDAPAAMTPAGSNEAAPQPSQPLPAAPATTSPEPPTRAVGTTPSRAHVEKPYTPPAAEPTDHYGVRAKAAGLHPDLSRALLADLSDTDYRNANTAVRRAMAQPSDDAVVKWPRKREGSAALFEVRFVSGAPPHCRRYIVTVEKNRWLTTAQPVDACSAIRKASAH